METAVDMIVERIVKAMAIVNHEENAPLGLKE